MDPRTLRQARLAAHLLDAPLDLTPAELVTRFAAMQAQEPVPSKWSIGRRIRGGSEAAVDAALDDGSVLRTHVLRPTWHYVAARDLRWIQSLTAERVHASNASRYRALGLDARTLSRAHRRIARALEGGRHLTRRELGARLEADGLGIEGQRLAHLVMHAELELVVCSGPQRGKQQTYALVDERVPPAPSLDREAALGELATRYFTTRGPATERDFRWWFSLRAADARRALEIAGPRLEAVASRERTYWAGAVSASHPGRRPAGQLLQLFDEYVVAYSESRDALGIDPLAPSGRRLRYLHSAFVQGRTVGRWRPDRRAGTVEVELEPLVPLGARDLAALRAAARRYGRYVGAPVELTVLDLAEEGRGAPR